MLLWFGALNIVVAQDERAVCINWITVVFLFTNDAANIPFYLHVYVSLEDGISEGVNNGV